MALRQINGSYDHVGFFAAQVQTEFVHCCEQLASTLQTYFFAGNESAREAIFDIEANYNQSILDIEAKFCSAFQAFKFSYDAGEWDTASIYLRDMIRLNTDNHNILRDIQSWSSIVKEDADTACAS